jgi:hypothetical protein
VFGLLELGATSEGRQFLKRVLFEQDVADEVVAANLKGVASLPMFSASPTCGRCCFVSEAALAVQDSAPGVRTLSSVRG